MQLIRPGCLAAGRVQPPPSVRLDEVSGAWQHARDGDPRIWPPDGQTFTADFAWESPTRDASATRSLFRLSKARVFAKPDVLVHGFLKQLVLRY